MAINKPSTFIQKSLRDKRIIQQAIRNGENITNLAQNNKIKLALPISNLNKNNDKSKEI